MFQNDRKITVAVGESRKSTRWQNCEYMLSAFYGCLGTPKKGSDALVDYLSMKKAQQDDLKDVGGYVCGTLNSPRRKANNVTGRDVITLDLDNIPAGGTADVMRRVEGLGVGYCIYSTRKHHEAAPRLRVLVPFDRTVSADEYEPCARKMAEYIGLELADPTTFEVARLMYWPSCCSDSAFIYYYADKPFVSADGLLGQYADWRNVSLWPSLPGAQTFTKLAVKQGDPEGKAGVVGAFCRTYDIHRAMDELIPGIYEPVDNAPGRYTYLGGSTTGGAVLYDDGKFIFSHHATDPCGGRLVNAFDMVRLHKFADLDADAADGTFSHQLPSYKAMCDYAESIPEVKRLFVKERGEKVQREFADVSSNDGGESGDDALAEYLGSLKGEILTIGVVRGLLNGLGIAARVNEISRDGHIDGHPQKWSSENAENHLPVHLLDYLKLAGVKGSSKNAICDYLDIIADENRYNPVIDMFRSRQWDRTDRVSVMLEILGLGRDSFHARLYYKGLLQSVAMPHNNAYNPFGADGVPTLLGPQGIGKTSAVREIIPAGLRSLFKESVILDPRNKDSIIESTSRWINELGELDGITKRDQQGVKGFITATTDEYRTPYARKKVRVPRRTIFWGSVNPNEYLTDDTGNRRFWTIPITYIDLDRLFGLSDEWKLQLWAQLYASYLQNPQGFRLTREERSQLEQENQEHTKPLDYELEVRSLFNYDLPIEQWGTFTTAELAGRMIQRPPANRLGRVLAKLAREDARLQIPILHGCSQYKLPIVKVPTSSQC